MIEKAESPYLRVFVSNWLHFDIYSAELISKPVSCSSVTSLNLQVSAGIREAVSARGFGHVSADPEASRTQKKPLIPKVPVKKTDTEYLNYYPITMLVFFRSSLVSSISRLSDKQFNERLNNGEPNNKHRST